MDWHCYILECENGALYTGVARDVNARFKAHQAGAGAKYTRANKPVRIAWRQGFIAKSDAYKREAQIKAMTRAEKSALVGRVG